MAVVLDGFAADLYARLEPYAHVDEENGEPLAILCKAIGEQFRDVDLIVRDSPETGTPGWARLFDLEETAELRPWALDWVGQVAGARVPVGMDPAAAVTYIREIAGHRRGTPAAMRAAVYETLETTRSPEQAVRILERDTSAYHLTVVTRTSETPDAAAAEAAARSQKPIGLILDFTTSNWPLIDEGTALIDDVEQTINAATVADVTA